MFHTPRECYNPPAPALVLLTIIAFQEELRRPDLPTASASGEEDFEPGFEVVMMGLLQTSPSRPRLRSLLRRS
jgi:hypothetical protein